MYSIVLFGIVVLSFCTNVSARPFSFSRLLLSSTKLPTSTKPARIKFIDATLMEPADAEDASFRPTSPKTKTGIAQPPADLADKIAQLQKMDWSPDDARDALLANEYDVERAAAALEKQQDDREQLATQVDEVSQLGWKRAAAEVMVKATNGNVSEAILRLEEWERGIATEFNETTHSLMRLGLDEALARRALLEQFKLDGPSDGVKRETSPMSDLERAKLTPTLREAVAQSPADSITPPAPAALADVVFEVTADSFQSVVLESPVPVLLDVYAPWCGPCKRLAPILEATAVQSGGAFRLAKLNSDTEGGLAESLDIRSLPTVFAVRDGLFTDRLHPGHDLRKFIDRLVSGVGERQRAEKAEDDCGDKQLEQLTTAAADIAGLSALTFKDKARLRQLVENALSSGEVTARKQGILSDGVKVALQYIGNCRKDIRNPRYRSISTANKVFAQRVARDQSALRLLEAAGFRLKLSDVDKAKIGSTQVQTYELTHRNAALLALVAQNVDEVLRQHRENASSTAAPLPSFETENNNPYQKTTTTTTSASTPRPSPSAASTNVAKPVEPTVAAITVFVRRRNGGIANRQFSRTDRRLTLRSALQQLLGSDERSWQQLELRQPAPRRRIDPTAPSTAADSLLDRSLADIAAGGNVISIAAVQTDSNNDEDDKEGQPGQLTTSGKGLLKKLTSRLSGRSKPAVAAVTQRRLQQQQPSAAVVKDKKSIEYFGGDSTVTLSSSDEEGDDGDDDVQEVEKVAVNVDEEEEDASTADTKAEEAGDGDAQDDDASDADITEDEEDDEEQTDDIAEEVDRTATADQNDGDDERAAAVDDGDDGEGQQENEQEEEDEVEEWEDEDKSED